MDEMRLTLCFVARTRGACSARNKLKLFFFQSINFNVERNDFYFIHSLNCLLYADTALVWIVS